MRGNFKDALGVLGCCVLLCSGCAQQDRPIPSSPREGERDQARQEKPTDKTVSIEGVAMDAKAGGVVVIDDDVFYIDSLLEWPAHLVGKRVRVVGVLTQEKQIPDPGPDLAKQGAFGSQSIIKNAKWEEVHPDSK